VISLQQARAIITTVMAGRSPQVERVDASEGLGRTLAETIFAPSDLPAHANSAMDGYALRLSDCALDVALAIQGQTHAAPGSVQVLLPAQAMRVATGALIPNGADTVLIQENAEVFDLSGAFLRVLRRPKLGENIRLPGSDFAKGSVLLRAGTTLGPQHLAVLAAFNVQVLRAFARPRVSVLVSGDELLAQGAGRAQPGQIFDSNRPLLAALLQGDAANAKLCPILPDTLDAIRTQLELAASHSDVILTAGGASVGDKDFMPQLVRELGVVHFHKVQLKPGMPVLFGEIAGTPILCLPGNPVSVFVTYLCLARDLIALASGRDVMPLHAFPLPLQGPIEKSHARPEFLRASLQRGSDGALTAAPLVGQFSSMLHSLAAADGLISLPAGAARYETGAHVEFLPFHGLLR
jgi:molybdopterin molybdotransferase